MSVTYTVTEADGFTHTRTSARHLKPIYTYAVVHAPRCGKALVTYSSRLDLAQKTLSHALAARHRDYSMNRELGRVGQPIYPDAKIYPVTAVVKKPRA